MVTTRPDLVEPELSKIVFDAFYAVYRELGYGYLERVYENALMIALCGSGVDPVQQASLVVRYRGHVVGEYRADIIIPGRLLIEVKSATVLTSAHEGQLLNYLRATGLPLGMILNFGPRPTAKRRVN